MKPDTGGIGNETQTALTVPLDTRFVETVTSFAETTASALGLGAAEARRLRLAAEEVFTYLTGRSGPRSVMHLEAASGGYFVQLTGRFEASGFDPRALNLTAEVDPEDEASLDQMGLLIASRMVHRFHLKEASGGKVCLTLIKEKSYPEPEGAAPDPPPVLQDARVRPARPDDLLLLARYLPAHHPLDTFPPDFRLPGKVVDMAASGEYRWVVGVDGQGHLGGGLAWRFVTPRTAECFGPYLVNQPEDSPLAEGLVESCLSGLAKTEAVGLICRYATDRLPQAHFESAGTTMWSDPKTGQLRLRPAFHRLLHEDPGARVWCVPELEGFLRSHYDRLFLARELLPAEDTGQERPAHSVLFAEFERTAKRVTLRPAWDGRDLAENIRRHLQALRADGWIHLFFELDLARSREAQTASLLLHQGFEPRVILPRAGDGDVLLLQYVE